MLGSSSSSWVSGHRNPTQSRAYKRPCQKLTSAEPSAVTTPAAFSDAGEEVSLPGWYAALPLLARGVFAWGCCDAATKAELARGSEGRVGGRLSRAAAAAAAAAVGALAEVLWRLRSLDSAWSVA